MRISSNTIYQTGPYNMQSLQNRMVKLNMQIDSGKRVVTPADDPVAAARVLQLNQSQGQNDQFISNSKAASSWLEQAEAAVQGASNLMIKMKEAAIRANNGSYSTEQLQAIQKEVNEGLAELTAYANGTDGRGEYLFSGNKTTTPPFSVSLTSVPPASYQGDDGQRSVQISGTRQLTISDPGNSIFGAPGGSPTAAFDALINLSNTLGTDPIPPTIAADLQASMNAIDAAQKQMSQSLASLGARGQENDNLQSMATSLQVQYASTVSDLEDLDMAKAISDFTMIQTSLKYTQATYGKVVQLSLLNYIS